jgi:malate/lactate dehydrogenase
MMVIPEWPPMIGTISGTTLDELVQHIQFAGDEVVQAKNGAGSATLAMALAGARFAEWETKGMMVIPEWPPMIGTFSLVGSVPLI